MGSRPSTSQRLCTPQPPSAARRPDAPELPFASWRTWTAVRYAGPVGWIDSRGDGAFGIALRCAQIDARDSRTLRMYAGCGIVAGSVPADELAESQTKLLAMREALESG